MNIDQALAILNKNLPALYCKCRKGEPLAREVVRSYLNYVREPHIVTEELVINNVQAWQEYEAENPQAEG